MIDAGLIPTEPAFAICINELSICAITAALKSSRINRSADGELKRNNSSDATLIAAIFAQPRLTELYLPEVTGLCLPSPTQPAVEPAVCPLIEILKGIERKAGTLP